MTDWVFVEEVEQPKLKSDIIELIETEKPLNRFGKIWCDSAYLNERGVKKGDIVFFEKNADYEMVVDGKKVWRMMFEHLIFVADENYLEVYNR
jgi:co-chaperonin GroES (HSP10)